ncbi:MAG: tetratricopeptide repeat protein [Anaerolineae bacterium]|nr:tetratricopeptide repeat protein [Anaerolineae bacterium]NUQ06429.1 tetratricopeptide repeat protein [Anaerolineae bacterium]
MPFRRRVVHGVILLLCLGGVLTASAQGENPPTETPTCDPALTADDYISRGIEAYNAEDYETAIVETLCAQAADPENPVVYNNIAFYLGRLGRTDEALETYAEAIRLDPAYRSALVNRGDLYLSLEEYASAIADYDRAIEVEPSGYAHNRRGIAYFNLNDYAAAEADFAAAFALEPDEAVFVRNRAAARFQLERYDEAAEDFATAWRISPDWDVPAFGVADSLFAGGRYDAAQTAYREAVTRFGGSDSVNARLREIAVLRSAGLVQFAAESASEAISVETAPRLAALARLGDGDAHASSVLALDVNADGSRILTADFDGALNLWDGANPEGEPIFSVTTDASVATAALSPDGAFAVASLLDGRIVMVKDGEIVELLGVNDGRAAGLAFTPDGGLLATALFDGSVILWDLPTETQIGRFYIDNGEPMVNENSANPVAISPDGALLASVTDDRIIRLWDVETGENSAILESERAVFSLAFSPDASLLLAGGFSSIAAFDIASGETVDSAALTDIVGHLSYSPDGALVLASGGEIPLTLLDAATLDIVTRLGSGLLVGDFTPDSARLIAGGTDESVPRSAALIFEPFSASLAVSAKTLQPITAENAASLELLAEAPVNEARGVAWSAESEALFVGSANGVYRFPLDGEFGALTALPFGTFGVFEGRPVYWTNRSENGERMIRLYDLDDLNAPIRSLSLGDVRATAFTANDEAVTAVVTRSDGAGLVGVEVVRFPFDGGAPESLVTPEGLAAVLAQRDDGLIALAPSVRLGESLFETAAIQFIDAAGEVTEGIAAPHPYIDVAGALQRDAVRAIFFSADGNLLLTWAGGAIRLWREDNGGAWQPIANLELSGLATEVVLSPSGRLLAVLAREEIIVYTASDGGEHIQLTEAVRLAVEPIPSSGALRFNADETMMAISTSANTVQVWGVAK